MELHMVEKDTDAFKGSVSMSRCVCMHEDACVCMRVHMDVCGRVHSRVETQIIDTCIR